MRGDFPVASARWPPRLSIVSRRAPAARGRDRGRSIASTKVKALPEWLGQCKLLETLCARACRRRRLARSRRCPAHALLRLRCRAGALGCTTQRWKRRRRRCRSSAAAKPRSSMFRNAADRRAVGVGRSRPGRPHGWRAGTRATPSSRRCRRRSSGRTWRQCERPCLRAHTAPPMRRRVLCCAASGARTKRARLGTCVCVHMCVCVWQCMHVYAYLCAHAQNAFQLAYVPGRARGRAACACARQRRRERRAAQGGDLHLGITEVMYINVCVRVCVCVCACVRTRKCAHVCVRSQNAS